MGDRRWWLAGVAACFLSGGHLATCVGVRAEEGPPTVRLVVDYGDGVEKHFTAIPWKPKMTVFDVLQAAARHRRGIRVRHRGSGETTFVLEIDGLKNEGRSGRNWVYRVDGKLGDRSCGVYRVKAGQTVLWTFATYP